MRSRSCFALALSLCARVLALRSRSRFALALSLYAGAIALRSHFALSFSALALRCRSALALSLRALTLRLRSRVALSLCAHALVLRPHSRFALCHSLRFIFKFVPSFCAFAFALMPTVVRRVRLPWLGLHVCANNRKRYWIDAFVFSARRLGLAPGPVRAGPSKKPQFRNFVKDRCF